MKEVKNVTFCFIHITNLENCHFTGLLLFLKTPTYQLSVFIEFLVFFFTLQTINLNYYHLVIFPLSLADIVIIFQNCVDSTLYLFVN